MSVVFRDPLSEYSSGNSATGGGWARNFDDFAGPAGAPVAMNVFDSNNTVSAGSGITTFSCGFNFSIDSTNLAAASSRKPIFYAGDLGAGQAGAVVYVDSTGKLTLDAPINGTMTTEITSAAGVIVAGQVNFIEIAIIGSLSATGEVGLYVNGTLVGLNTGLIVSEGHAVGPHTALSCTEVTLYASFSASSGNGVHYGDVYVQNTVPPRGSFPPSPFRARAHYVG